jgi:ABC-type antimicrobial peptide transport system permease subunit
MALGAQRTQVIQMIVNQGIKIGAWGIAIGVVAALGFTRLMVSLLYGVTPHDPAVFWGVATTLALVVGVASAGPALRAALLDPVAALRHE